MDGYRQDCSYSGISRPVPATFKALSPEDKTTFRNWRRAVLAFYGAVLLLGGLVIVTSISVPHRQVAQATPAVNHP
jgi:hypothetical protein